MLATKVSEGSNNEFCQDTLGRAFQGKDQGRCRRSALPTGFDAIAKVAQDPPCMRLQRLQVPPSHNESRREPL